MLRGRFIALVALSVVLSACEQKEKPRTNYTMGERVDLGPFSYVVVESSWLNQLGEGFQIRSPQNRYLVLTIAVTNRGNSDLAVPLLTLEGPNGQEYKELEDGTGLSKWLGMLRSVGPAQSLQGRIIFDVPLSSFKLRLPESSDTGYDKYAWVEIPLRIDANDVQAPLPDLNQ